MLEILWFEKVHGLCLFNTCWQTVPSSRVITAGSRWQCSGLICGRLSEYPIQEQKKLIRSQTLKRRDNSTPALLCCPSLWPPSSLTPLSLSQSSFVFGAKSYQKKGISRGLSDRSTHAWGFDASNPNWVKHRIDASLPPTFFLILTRSHVTDAFMYKARTLVGPRGALYSDEGHTWLMHLCIGRGP